MSVGDAAHILRVFRRQMAWVKLLRAAGFIAIAAGVYGALTLDNPQQRGLCITGVGAVIAAWLVMVMRSIRLTREIRAGSLLLSLGRLDDAEVWLRRGVTTFSLSQPSKLIAGELLAMLMLQRGKHQEVIDLCREMLRHSLKRLRDVWVNTRLILADSLLVLGRVNEAREALSPLSMESLSLDNRMKLLPTQLRCQLRSGDSAGGVLGLTEKVRMAELMESPRAALVHALLAEACRQQGMQSEHEFLAERARLYHDLRALAERFPIIAPIAEADGTPG